LFSSADISASPPLSGCSSFLREVNYGKINALYAVLQPAGSKKKRGGCTVSNVIPIKGLFEAHIIVRDMQRSVAFYRDVLGLEVGIEQPERPAAFFWVGGRGKSMLGIFTLGSWPTQMMQHHLSFQVKLENPAFPRT
jgi:predicted enzyme related to lactoylglutathione lyase